MKPTDRKRAFADADGREESARHERPASREGLA